jgi:hypothetical protein
MFELAQNLKESTVAAAPAITDSAGLNAATRSVGTTRPFSMTSFYTYLAACAATLAAVPVCAQPAEPTQAGKTIETVAGQQLPLSKADPMEGWQRMQLQINPKRAGGKAVDNIVSFAPDGRLRVQVHHSKRGVSGSWSLKPGFVCLSLPVRGAECFSYPRTLLQNETAAVTSDRGWTGTVTMLTDPTGSPLAQTSTPTG